MTPTVLTAAHAASVTASGPGFVAPGPKDFVYPPLFDTAGLQWLNKPILMFMISMVLVFLFYYLGARKRALVPGRFQFAVESVYDFVRNGIAKDVIGPDFARFVPFLATLFGAVLINNIFGIFPLVQFPTFARVGFPFVLAFFSWVTFLYVGIKRAGFLGYFKGVAFPPGIPVLVYLILAPVEILQVLFIRPFTLGLRLAANMFAGHLLLVLFTLGGAYMLTNDDSLLLTLLSPISFLAAILLTSFEALIEVLQAYIFVLLAALYIAEAASEEH